MMTSKSQNWGIALVALTLLQAAGIVRGHQSSDRTIITLRRTTVDELANRVTVDARFKVIGPQQNAHSPASDGEAHVSGVTLRKSNGSDYGFAGVAEILHAEKYEGGLLDWIASKKNGTPILLRGVWRIWAEHGTGTFVQGQYDPPSTWSPPSNPNHVWEIHPITHIFENTFDEVGPGRRVLLGDFVYQKGYTKIDQVSRTRGGFGFLKRAKCNITKSGDQITIDSEAHKYNFLKFKAVLKSAPQAATDAEHGLFVMADIFDQEGKGETTSSDAPLASNVRLCLVKGTPVATAVEQASVGDTVYLVGFPRVNLARVKEIIQAGQTYQSKPLPFEIVVSYEGE